MAPQIHPVKGEELPRIRHSPFGIPLTGWSIAPLIPKVRIDTMPHCQRDKLVSAPAGIVPAKMLAGLAGLFLLFHNLTSIHI